MATSFLTDDLGFYILKDPVSILDYEIDWETWLDVDTILTSNFTVEAGLTKASQSLTATKGIVWLSGGTLGETYLVSNTITTAGGRTENREFRVLIANK
ncbi:MAG: hypothetical protein ACOVKC_03430 [Brevundimonas sp.]